MSQSITSRKRCETTYDTTEGEIRDWVLFSGGHDSLVCAHYLMENGYTDAVLHLDTNTGIPENEEFVIEVCEEYGWPLRIEQAPCTLREFALEMGDDDRLYGLPVPSTHIIAYSVLKERSLESVAVQSDVKPVYWTGVRRNESDRRMNVIEEAEKEDSSWVWKAPIRNWTNDRMEEYLDEHEIPRNPVVQKIHRSGECFCGAFANRDEDFIDLEAHYPDHYEWILEVEEEVRETIDQEDDPRAWWGNVRGDDLVYLKNEYDVERELVLCRDCKMEAADSALDW